jgi:hypothetical protein
MNDDETNDPREGSPEKVPFRLAFRVERQYWVAYFASPETMDHAIELGRLLMTLAVADGGAMGMIFQDLITDAVSKVMQETTGAVPTDWVVEPGPDHERMQ